MISKKDAPKIQQEKRGNELQQLEVKIDEEISNHKGDGNIYISVGGFSKTAIDAMIEKYSAEESGWNICYTCSIGGKILTLM